MCGIAGIVHADRDRPGDGAAIAPMLAAAAHRGPDGQGVWTAPGVALGHLRLAIIDLAGSPQPMVSADGQAVLVFNGEIYNFRELRRELAATGTRFVTDGDSEVILAAWQRWGVDCLPRLDGMFAFALYDRASRELLLARDRLGVKPLITARLGDGSVIFASELKQVLAHPQFERRIDPLAVEDFMAWGYVPDTRAMLAGVEKLPAGHYRLLRPGARDAPPVQWWDVSFADRATARPAVLQDELHDLLRRAVTSRMVADVPLGAFLSGGVDSSAVVALMSEASAAPVQTCSIGFDVASLDETHYAETIATRFGTNHRTRRVGSGDYAAIDTIVAMFDEPFADASALPTWRVCQLAREHVMVALSGDGADEAFAGYRRQVFHAREDRVRRALPLAQPLFGALGRAWPAMAWAPRPLRARATLQSLGRDADTAYAHSLAVTRDNARDRLYSSEFKRLRADYRAETPLVALMRGAPALTALDRAQYADCKWYLPGDILTKVDRASMAVSLEAREPLLDHRLVEFAARLPDDLRVHGGTGKWLLKQTMRSTLPDDVLFRPKMGFVTPIAAWFRHELADAARGIARGGALARTGWFDPRALAECAETHIAGRADTSRTLWQLLMLDRALERLAKL